MSPAARRLILLCLPLAMAPHGSRAQTAPAADGKVEGVVVSAARAASETAIDRRSYSVAGDLQAQTGSLADVLRNIPSVQVDLQGAVSLRGSANVTVLVDGKPSSQFSGETLAQALQSLPASQIDRIEVMTNPSAEFRADGSAGVINLVMKTAKGAGTTGSIRLQGATGRRAMAAANLSYNSNRLSTVADLSLRQDRQVLVTDNRHTEPNGGDSLDLNRGRLSQQVVNANLRSDYDLTARTRLSGALRFTYFHGDQPSLDRFERYAGARAPVAAFTRRTVQQATQYNSEATATARHTWAEGHDLALTAVYSAMQFQRRRFDRLSPTLPAGLDQTAAFDRRTHNDRAAITAAYQTPMPGKARLKLGYDFDYSSTAFRHGAGAGGVDGRLAADPAQTGLFLDEETRNQAYLTYERPVGKLNALVGLRGEVLHLALEEKTRGVRATPTYRRLYPSLHLGYDLSNRRTLSFSYSRRLDRPPYALLDPIPYPQNPGFVLQGNVDLRPQSTDSVELGFERRKDAGSVSATLYYRRTRDAFSALYTNRPDGTLLQQTTNAGRRTDGGLELTVADKLTRGLGYSLTANAYWTELAAPGLSLASSRQALAGFGRANLDWQVSPRDFVQVNVFVNGKTLLPQGHVAPFASGNIGYRRTVARNASLLLVVQDPFNSVRTRQVLNGGADRRLDTTSSRMASLTLVWNFSGKPQTADFDFRTGGRGAVTPP
jgi:outer membrane receptor protein involved in Fe transport